MAALYHHPGSPSWPTAATALPANCWLAEIATVNDTGTETIRVMSPLMAREARDPQETQRAVSRLRSREAMVHAAVTQILLDWLATPTGHAHGEVIQQLALRLYEMFEQPGPPRDGGLSDEHG